MLILNYYASRDSSTTPGSRTVRAICANEGFTTDDLIPIVLIFIFTICLLGISVLKQAHDDTYSSGYSVNMCSI